MRTYTTHNVILISKQRENKQHIDAHTLTIMLSRACLASQQLRKTGIKRFLRVGQKICKQRLEHVMEVCRGHEGYDLFSSLKRAMTIKAGYRDYEGDSV